MAVPDYQSLMLPLLNFVESKGTETSTNEAVEALAKELNLTEDDLKEMLPSGFWRITQHSTGRQKQARFYQLANYWLKKVIISKVIPFLLLPPVSLYVIRFNFIQSYNQKLSFTGNGIKFRDMSFKN